MSLDDLLDATGGRRSPDFAGRLRHPAFWPCQEAEAGRLERIGLPAPAGPAPGQVLLVSVSDTGKRRTLWALDHSRPSGRDKPFGAAAEGARLLAEQLVLRDLPVVGDPRALFPPRVWSARILHVDGGGADAALDGDSFGASFLLAAASIALRRPVPSTIAASAALRPDGAISTVGRLEEKANALDRFALGVRTLLVHQDQVAIAEQGLHCGRVKVEGVTNARDLLEKVFPGFDAPGALEGAWEDLELARLAAEQLFGLALGSGSSLLAWRPLRQVAERLLSRLGDDPAASRASFARQVFARHAGLHAPLEPLAEPDARTLPEPIRLQILANVVQAAADSFKGIDEKLEMGRAALPPDLRACHADHLRLRGAMGRALAHARRYVEAADWLEETVKAWLGLRLPGQASYSLCELARVRGILRDTAGLRRMEGYATSMERDTGTSLASLGYLDLALGRAWVLCDDPGRALNRLDSAALATSVTRPDVQTTRLRWKAQALGRLGRADQAEGARAECAKGLRSMQDGDESRVDLALFALDEAVVRGGEVAEILKELRVVRPDMVHVLGGGLDGPDLARRLVDEYPY